MSGFQNGYQRRYTEEDAAIVDEAKRIHKETTKSAQNALKVGFAKLGAPVMSMHCLRSCLNAGIFLQTAERTKELASNTLEELNRQGQNLDRVDRDLNEAGLLSRGCELMIGLTDNLFGRRLMQTSQSPRTSSPICSAAASCFCALAAATGALRRPAQRSKGPKQLFLLFIVSPAVTHTPTWTRTGNSA